DSAPLDLEQIGQMEYVARDMIWLCRLIKVYISKKEERTCKSKRSFWKSVKVEKFL
ncbi:2015_t:CDS:1, partial [Dentiscutata erythropus]